MGLTEVRRMWIPGPAGRLEAALRVATRPVGTAVVAHPHPLHGGTLHNPVVFHAERNLHLAGLTTIRFNFRGVGDSEGSHDAGHGEVADLAAAASWVRGLATDVPLIVVGYSFGSVCAVRAARNDRSIRAVIGIGLPVRTFDFAEVEELNRPLAVVQAADDEFGTIEEVRRLLERASPRGTLYVVDGSSHLFPGRAREAGHRVRQAGEAVLRQIG